MSSISIFNINIFNKFVTLRRIKNPINQNYYAKRDWKDIHN